MTLLHTPHGTLPVTRASDTEACAAFQMWLRERYVAGCVDPAARVMQAVVLPAFTSPEGAWPAITVLVDADMVTEAPTRPRLVR